MSGNSTQLGVSLASGDLSTAKAAAALLTCFTLGAGFGSGLGRHVPRWRRPTLLVVEAVMLALAVLLAQRGLSIGASCLIAAAMGLENATFLDRKGEIAITLTFVTGTLVRLGEGIATACLGGPRWVWLRHASLWFGLVCGGIAGAESYRLAGLNALLIVSGLLVLVAIELAVVDPEDGVG
jgi:uncharacterized membrane protein YoaK (UPF0700 family)